MGVMRWTWVVVGVLVSLMPIGAAQVPVESCWQQCHPQDADVNADHMDYTNVVLFGHRTEGLGRAVMTTQLPTSQFDPDVHWGVLMPALQTRTGTPADVHFGVTDSLMQTSGAALVLDDQQRVVQPQDRGLQELRFASQPVVLYAYFSVEDAVDAGSEPPGAGVAPLMRVEATWELGNVPGEGPLLAYGSTQPFSPRAVPGQETVYEVRIEMERTLDVVPTTWVSGIPDLFTVRSIQVDHETATLTQTGWHLRSGVDLPWRVLLPLENPLESFRTVTQYSNGTAWIQWIVRSPMGSYDVDESTFRLTAQGPEGEVAWTRPPTVFHRADAFESGHLPVMAAWNVTQAELEVLVGGEFSLSVSNLQHTYELTDVVPVPQQFVLQRSATPGLEVALVLAAVAALALCLAGRRD